ncbi:MAG: EcsC family protein [Desulfosporosinus sp.]|nr:EcsC family protein [Desulfosporosinus sp.]MBC2727752.1 EcsC family protein [Desulfosporosinus sp.]
MPRIVIINKSKWHKPLAFKLLLRVKRGDTVPLYRDPRNHEPSYEDHVRAELNVWVRKLLQRPGLLERTSKVIQTKINERVIPEKVHTIITATVKGLVKSVVFGLEYIPNSPVYYGIGLQERDQKAQRLLSKYRKIAAAEGAGTGAGGFTLAVADFPALIVIKMRFLFELAHNYGFSTEDYRERLFLLYVFQLAFSSQEKRPELYKIILNWDKTIKSWPEEKEGIKQVNWEQFQREYRDAIDFRKTLQLIPGLGAIVGAWANYGLVDDLGMVGINCYRLRILGGVQVDKSHSARY